MCVIFFYVNSNAAADEYKLVLASNRDEFYERKTQQACEWPEAEHVYGGVDLEPGREGGTWLAVSGKEGIFKVGALLNLTGEPKPRNAIAFNGFHKHHSHSLDTAAIAANNGNSLLGRGMIVADFVRNFTTDYAIETYNRNLLADCEKYSAFNFISIELGDSIAPARIMHCSNVPVALTNYAQRQCYGFGNSLPTVPFEKVLYGQSRFEEIVQQNQHTAQETTLVAELQSLLKHNEKFWPDAELQRRAPNWGMDLSALNVDMPKQQYGSRTHTVLLIDGANRMLLLEETMAEMQKNGKWLETRIEKQF